MITDRPAVRPPIELTLMIDPPPAVAMCRAACLVPASTPSRFTPITRLKSARSSSRKLRCIVPETPALFTITCSPPNEAG